MKYLIPFVLVAIIFSCASKKESARKKIVMDKNSLSKTDMAKVNPMFLDTTYSVMPDGGMKMSISVSKDLDTTYVENPVDGKMNMIVSRKGKPARVTNSPNHKSGDTIYVEHPVTGKIHMVITD